MPDNLHIISINAHIIDPTKEKVPILVTRVIGNVEKLNKVSATNFIFF